MLTAIIPVLFMLIGTCVYALSANPKVAELGRLLFWAGAFVVCLVFSGQGVSWP